MRTTIIRPIILAILAASPAVQAAQTVPQSAGTILQQIPPAPKVPQALPEIQVQEGGGEPHKVDDKVKIEVKTLKITGSQKYSEEELIRLLKFKPGKYSLLQLRAMAAIITLKYRMDGYFVAHAILPAQRIEDGVVHIIVRKGTYDKITLRNATNLSDALAKTLLSGIEKGDDITVRPLEERLLLLSDLPGVNVHSTLVPGSSAGTSDLIVDVKPGRRVTGSLQADNEGNPYTGANRLGATVNINDLAGHGDMASLQMLTSNQGLNYGKAGYQYQIGRAKIGAAYTRMQYWLGSNFASLNAFGYANIVSAYATYPLIRTRFNNLYATINHDSRSFQDNQGANSIDNGRHADVWMSTLAGDEMDHLLGGGSSNYSLTWSSGEMSINNPAVLASDATTTNVNGHYDKAGFSGSRVQNIANTVSLSAAVHGQVASRNLDVSEKMELGGAGGVRAYPEGEAYGDQGYVLNVEARKTLPNFSTFPGVFQLIGFVDTGTVTINRNLWAGATGVNRRTLSGTGVGLDWDVFGGFSVQTYLAHKLGNAMATSAPDSMNRFWIQGVKFF